MTKKERIIALSDVFSDKEISKVTGASLRYVKAVLQQQPPSELPKLTVSNYVAAKARGLNTKEDLCNYFSVSRPTLWRFEKSNREILQSYYHLKNLGTREIMATLAQARDVLAECEPSGLLLRKIKAAIKSLNADKSQM